ncbi:MAG: hypothetical protein JJ974_09295 [Phycisphaerales bacterium]|nr:hypothetical protein [Phycisphaerales bacterium]
MSESSLNAQEPTTQNPILWGAYLGCSWTWCIGMFFPVLLLRDFGWAGFVAFAVPNVLGAAAMGWVLRSRDDSRSFVDRHPRAVWWFSAVTIGFHAFWIVWISSFIRDAVPMPEAYLFGAGAIAVAFAISSGRLIRRGLAPQLAMMLWVVSAGVLVALMVVPDAKPALDVLIEQPRTGAGVGHGVLWFVPVSIFGFLMCPYLDVTFHHARQNLATRSAGRIGFTVGFCVFFALMIVLTTQYAGVIAAGMRGDGGLLAISTPWLAAAVLVHVFCQWIFTVRVHLDRMRTLTGDLMASQRALFGVVLVSVLAGFMVPRMGAYAGLTSGEIVYRCFLTFYGLVFPAYMLYRVVRKHGMDEGSRIPLQRWMMWLAIGVAAPMFWMGFIERQSVWLGPGMIVVVCGAFVLKGTSHKESFGE